MYEIRITHQGLNKFRVIRGATVAEAQIKATLQQKAWNEQWQRRQQAALMRQKRKEAANNKEMRKLLAAEQDKEAKEAIDAIEKLLQDATTRDHRVAWSSLKDLSVYPVPYPDEPQLTLLPTEPLRMAFVPQMNWLARLVTPIREKRMEEAEQRFQAAHSAWRAAMADVQERNKNHQVGYRKKVAQWEGERQAWLDDQVKRNSAIDAKEAAYMRREAPAVEQYCEIVLNSSEYPDSFPSGFELQYLADSQVLILDYSLPDVANLPAIKGYRYVATRDEIQALPAADGWRNRAYDKVLYQIALRTLYELFQSDIADALGTIVFNGWVNSTDKATGKRVNACILSVQADKSEFLELNLAQVDPKACFRKLKGISAAKLVSLSPVRPILQLNKEDKRFIQPYGVAETLDTSTNLAAMDWEDFEHLIREVFEREFSAGGGEVKITQASRDRGVDAVAFDPDPIRGGKIVIQAKRYTNTVDVSAVRDLYGTILNEGANKGILVTTAEYGPEAYEFAKDKPITLLNGNELLYLLEKHGQKARIDLAEARMLAADNGKA